MMFVFFASIALAVVVFFHVPTLGLLLFAMIAAGVIFSIACVIVEDIEGGRRGTPQQQLEQHDEAAWEEWRQRRARHSSP